MSGRSDGFSQVALLSDLPENGKLTLELDDRFIVLVNLNGDIFCLDDVCTHDGGTLGDGDMEDHCLVCPRHGAKFDVRTGKAVAMPATEATLTHEVKIEEGRILVKLRQ